MNDIMNAKVFGADAKMHPITGMPIEQGHGALHPDAQAIGHWGEMQFEIAQLVNKRKDALADLNGERAKLAGMQIAHNALADDDISGRQNSLYALAAQDLAFKSAQRKIAHLTAEHEALSGKVAEVKVALEDGGMFDKFGIGPATSWLGMIASKGWSIPNTGSST